jgi:CBS domain-containing protein
MKVRDVMTTAVRAIRPDASLKEAAGLMAELRVSGLPVVTADGLVVGVLSEGDILFKEAGPAAKPGLLERLFAPPASELEAKISARTVGESMTAPAVTIHPERPVSEAAGVMIEQNVKRLPVVDGAGTLFGIVTRADLVRAFVRSDEDIEREIREDVIRRSLWIESESIQVTVERGEVRLVGQVESQAEAELIPEFVQRVPGVVSVLSKLRWPGGEERRNGHRQSRVEVWRS